MSKNITISKKDLKALIAAEVDLKVAAKEKAAKKGKKAAKKAKVWTDKKGRTFKQAQKAHYKARQARFEANPLGGLTKAQRQEIAATLPYGYTQKQWEKAVANFKKGGFR